MREKAAGTILWAAVAAWVLLATFILGGTIATIAQVGITVGQGPGISAIRTTISNASAYGSTSVGTSAVSVRGSTPTRTSVTLQNNNSSNTVYCGADSSVIAGGAGTANSGTVLGAGSPGGSYTWDRYTGEIWCIASGASTDVRYWEFTTQ